MIEQDSMAVGDDRSTHCDPHHSIAGQRQAARLGRIFFWDHNALAWIGQLDNGKKLSCRHD